MGNRIVVVGVLGATRHCLQQRFTGLLHHSWRRIGDLELAFCRLEKPSTKRDQGTTPGFGFQFIFVDLSQLLQQP